MTPTQLSIAFFLQVAVILVTCRLVGTAAQRWFGQPRVVGEMIAGVLLGPSLFGALMPEVQAFLFPKESKPILFVIAQFGVGLYMFLVGLGFDRDEFFKGAKGAAAVSLAGMAAPFGVALAIAPWLIEHGGLFTARVTQFEATLFMVLLAPRLLKVLDRRIAVTGMDETLLGVVLILYLLCAWAMDAVGIHAVFGGFLLGTAMPRGQLTAAIREKLEPVTVVLLLPFFFTYSGLHTELNLLADPALLAVAGLILVLSIAAKGGACYLAARLAGESHPTAMGIGALMNSRGLMELIVINIGLQRGIITPALFSMLVVMAIVTTLMASPLFEVVYGKKARAEGRL